MEQLNTYRQKFNDLRVCVIIPTYNNCHTLKKVIEGVLEYTDNILIINDGSTDRTTEILSAFPKVKTLHFPHNQGKGVALREGLRTALNQGYRYAVSIDSDGQHSPADLPAFIDKVEEEGECLIVGARNMDQDSVPGKSSFGHKFSNFWYKVETGINLPDTQSGYRLYPLVPLSRLRYVTKKFEFEIEVIVKAAWHGIRVTSVPVSVKYEQDRVSHFRPFRDFTRISILNTILVTLALLYYRPLMLWRDLKKKSIKEVFTEYLWKVDEPPVKKALSLGVGVFSGIIPLWGFQTVAALSLASIFRLNKFLAIVGSNISIPPMIPVILFLSYKTGTVFTGAELPWEQELTKAAVSEHLVTFISGSFVLAIIAGSICTGVFLFLLNILPKQKDVTANR